MSCRLGDLQCQRETYGGYGRILGAPQALSQCALFEQPHNLRVSYGDPHR